MANNQMFHDTPSPHIQALGGCVPLCTGGGSWKTNRGVMPPSLPSIYHVMLRPTKHHWRLAAASARHQCWCMSYCTPPIITSGLLLHLHASTATALLVISCSCHIVRHRSSPAACCCICTPALMLPFSSSNAPAVLCATDHHRRLAAASVFNLSHIFFF